jgi:hypothetical protein
MGMDRLGNKDLKDLELLAKQRQLMEFQDTEDLSEAEAAEVEKITKSLNGYESERLLWIQENCNDNKIKELIEHFNEVCQEAINELNIVLEN